MKKVITIGGISLLLVISLVYQLNIGNNQNSAASFAGVVDKKMLGKTVFERHCMSCHGKNAAGIIKDWRKPLANGRYPAPPLNGSAHAWHHSLEVLLSVIDNGSIDQGGQMPAFRDKLSAEEKEAVLYYLYSLWPNDIQEMWTKRFGGFANN